MAKSSLQKAIEKQAKESQKVARAAARRETAQSVVSGANFVAGFRVMDEESEVLLQEILNQYDGNENNYINFDEHNLPRSIRDSILVGFEKLKQYGVVSEVRNWMNGAGITLSENGKKYFNNKSAAYEREAAESERLQSIKITTAHKKYDVFISHASKDKLDYVDGLYMAVKKLGIHVFYDSEEISWGDNWKNVILDGTDSSEFAIIVISENFFDREWTNKELQEFLTRQNGSGQKIILPLLYNVTVDQFKERYPELQEIQCIEASRYNREMVTVLLAKELIKRYK
ncbi:MAG: toll/interleukin-1 receptor domain-containing protein [Lachnospiraceae bacterium]|nr:toll/interleukin-1 receptor domain-containing protein [Lachnospiraceae bacterium]